MPQINYVRPEVAVNQKKWSQISDCLKGQEQMVAQGTLYLPMPNAHDKSAENKERYQGYLNRAMFLNATANTLDGLVGQVFAADPVLDVPQSMAFMENDVDGAGVNLTQQAKLALSQGLAYGRTGILVDYPEGRVEDGRPVPFSREEMNDGTARPAILQFAPQDIINWRTRLIGAKSVLSLVVIAMSYIMEDDGFQIKTDTEWRVLRLDAGNLYVSEVWRKNDDPLTKGQEPFLLHKQTFPTDHRGQRLRYIPFSFIGSLNNDSNMDKPPMYDLSCVNVGHWRNSADYEDSVYMVGQPTPVATGLTKQWVDDVLKKKIQLGSRAVIPLPQGADLKLVAADENGMVKEAMEAKERQMVALGAQLVEDKEVQRTLGEAKMEKAVVVSVLVQCAKNVAAAYQQALRWCADFYGEDPEKIFYTLSTDFAIVRMSPEERQVLIAEYQGGLLAFEEARAALRNSGVAYLDDGKAKAAIDQEAEERMNMDVEGAAALAAAAGDNNGNADQE